MTSPNPERVPPLPPVMLPPEPHMDPVFIDPLTLQPHSGELVDEDGDDDALGEPSLEMEPLEERDA